MQRQMSLLMGLPIHIRKTYYHLIKAVILANIWKLTSQKSLFHGDAFHTFIHRDKESPERTVLLKET